MKKARMLLSMDVVSICALSLMLTPITNDDGPHCTSSQLHVVSLDMQEKLTYYLSNEGSDDADGLSPETAWQTIERLHDQWLDPGDEIKFRRGDVFRETFYMLVSGTKESPITLSAYGEGEKPVFSLPLRTEWEDQGNGVFRTPMTGSEFSGVWEDNIPVQPRASNRQLKDGRWFGSNNHVYYRPTSGSPGNHQVSAIDRIYSFDSGIWVSDQTYITISDLSFKGLPVGVYSKDLGLGTEGIVIKNCEFEYCQSAIFFLPTTSNNRGAVVDNNYFYRNHNSVRMFTASALAPGSNVNGQHINCEITNNEFFEDGTFDGQNRWDYGFTDYESIGLQNFSDGIIADNYIHDGVSIGVIFYNFDGLRSDDNQIVRNRIIDNNRVSLFFTGDDNQGAANYSFSGNMISHNILAGEKDSDNPGIWFEQGVLADRTNYFVHNVCLGKTQQIQITRSEIPSHLTVMNNIFYGVDYNIWIFQSSVPTELVLDNNVYYSDPKSPGWFMQKADRDLVYMQQLGFETNAVVEDPRFVSVADRDFHLMDDSPARQIGVPIPGVELDFEGNILNTKPDAGVFQHDSQTTSSNSLDREQDAFVFPNPVSDILTLKDIPVDSHFMMTDVWGKMVLNGHITSSQVDVSDLVPGVYDLRIGERHQLVVKQ